MQLLQLSLCLYVCPTKVPEGSLLRPSVTFALAKSHSLDWRLPGKICDSSVGFAWGWEGGSHYKPPLATALVTNPDRVIAF